MHRGRFPHPKVRKKQHKTKPGFVLRQKTGSTAQHRDQYPVCGLQINDLFLKYRMLQVLMPESKENMSRAIQTMTKPNRSGMKERPALKKNRKHGRMAELQSRMAVSKSELLRMDAE